MSWFRSLFRKTALEEQLDRELRFHVEEQIRDYVAAGVPAEEAQLRRSPGFAAAGVLSLALGIGANTAIPRRHCTSSE